MANKVKIIGRKIKDRDKMEHNPIMFERGQRNDKEYNEMLKETLGACLRFSRSAREILEFGAGTGLFSELLIPSFKQAKFSISEPDFNFLELAVKKFRRYKNISFFKALAQDFYSAKKFDLICGTEAYHHIPDREKKSFFDNVNRLLARGGFLVIGDNFIPPYRNEKERIESLHKFWDPYIEEKRKRGDKEGVRTFSTALQEAEGGRVEFKTSMVVLEQHAVDANFSLVYKKELSRNINEHGGYAVYVFRKSALPVNKLYSAICEKYVRGGIELPYDKKHEETAKYAFNLGINIFGPSPKIKLALQKVTNEDLLNYPDPQSNRLRFALANYHNLNRENFSLASGSDEITDRIMHLYGVGAKVLIPTPSYFRHTDAALKHGARIVYHYLNEKRNFEIDEREATKLIRRTKENKCKIVWLSSPNNPVGNFIHRDILEKIARSLDDRVIVSDEAYGEFTDPIGSAIPLIRQGLDNVLVMRSFSKGFGLAGIRSGYVIGPERLINDLESIRPMFSLDAIAERLSLTALAESKAYLRTNQKQIKKERDHFQNLLKKMKVVRFVPSTTVTIMMRISGINLFKELKARDIAVQNLDLVEGIGVKHWVRVSVRSRKDNEFLVDALKDIIKHAHFSPK